MKSEFLKNILVPIDTSDSSIMAEETAAKIAKKTGANVTVLHVITEIRMKYQIPQNLRDELYGKIEQDADRTISNAQALFSEEKVKMSAEKDGGSDPADNILKFSEKNFDLVVIGAHGETEKDEYALGSVTKKVMMHTTVPTLIVKRVSNLSNLLVCVDGSEQSINALNYAVKLAEKMDSKVTLLNVQERRLGELSPKIAKEQSEKIFTNALSGIEKGKSKAYTKLEIGSPSDKIAEVAERGKYDLIVLGNRGLGTVKRFLLGSVSDDVSHKAKCSVLIVPP